MTAETDEDLTADLLKVLEDVCRNWKPEDGVPKWRRHYNINFMGDLIADLQKGSVVVKRIDNK